MTADTRFNGTVTMGLGEEIIATAPMTGGAATLDVPAGTAPGSYPLELSDDPQGVANGFIRVVDGPALWVSTSPWTSTGDAQKATIETFGIPEGMTVALERTERIKKLEIERDKLRATC